MLRNAFLQSLACAGCFFMLLPAVYAQKGLPPDELTTATVNTFYPAHEDFKESMVTRLKTPAGYRVAIAATGLGKPRMMAAGPGNTLYVTRRDVGDVLLLADPDGDGSYDQLKTIVSNFPGVHGITIHEGWLYLCATKKLARGRLAADGTVGMLDTLLKDLPDGGQHDNRTIAFGPDGKLYVSVGSDCNDCKETNPEHATLIQMNADGSGRRVYARGLRNTLGFDWHPVTGELWGMDNGTDWRGEEIPPEELNRIIEDGHYGWPLVYGKQIPDPTREDPIGTTKEAYAKTTQAAVLTFPAHSAPLAFQFFHTGDALVTWHGSWNRKKPDGFKVQRIRFNNGNPVGAEDFLSGFLSADGKSRFGRPAGLAIAENGSVFISDDTNGVIYKVTSANP
ncbi:MAG: PQQ-dependent sugar dehydrogenase [Chitinophagaceae bacterium]